MSSKPQNKYATEQTRLIEEENVSLELARGEISLQTITDEFNRMFGTQTNAENIKKGYSNILRLIEKADVVCSPDSLHQIMMLSNFDNRVALSDSVI